VLDLKRLRRFLSRDYRNEYLDTTVRAGISYQISALRAKTGLTQTAFAAKLGKPQSVVSRLECSEYGRVTVQTLLDIAKALDIALVIRFVDYPTFFRTADRMAPTDLAVDDINDSMRKAESHINSNWNERLSQNARGNETAVAQPRPARRAPLALQESRQLLPKVPQIGTAYEALGHN
jgi:transcriptional regulator with XRE-family HTH domain